MGRHTHSPGLPLSGRGPFAFPGLPSPSVFPQPAWPPTSLDLLRSRTNLPSSSTSSTATRPLVRACCEKLLRLSDDSSLRFLVMLPPPCVWDECEEARPRLRCEVGLGDRRSLGRGRQSGEPRQGQSQARAAASASQLLPDAPLLLALQEFAVGVDLHVQRQLDVQQLLVLVQLLLHPCPHICHLPLLLGQ